MIAQPYNGLDGLGDASIPQVVGSSVSSGLWTAAAATGGPSNPVGLALTIGAGAATVITGILGIFGVGVPDVKKIQASNDVNQLEPYLQQNLAWWQNPSTPHTTANQQQAEATFNAVWNQVVQLCSIPSLGTAGQNCIKDRQPGGKWDWFAMYLTPISNSPVSDAGTITATASNLSTALGLGSSGVLWIGLAVLAFGVLLENE